MKGYIGKILMVDLSAGEIHSEEIPDHVYERLLSGVGLGAYVLYNRIPASADPLGPDNILGFVSGLLTGTPSFVTGRWLAVCKSPLTGGWGDSNCGGTFSPAIKRCGYDGIFFKGIAKEPVYLYVDNKGAELRSAAHLWGMDAIKAEETLIAENIKRKKPAVAVIGPAAEKLSLISGIVNEGGRISARSGVGAVMGSKHLKGVVLAGTKAIGCEDPHGMKVISKGLANKLRKANMPKLMGNGILSILGKAMGKLKMTAPLDGIMVGLLMKRWGTVSNNTMGVTMGDSPIKNWAGSVKDYNALAYSKINANRFVDLEAKKYHCFSCAIGCGGVLDLSNSGVDEFTHTHKPEYETCAAFGGLTLNTNFDSILYINELLNRAGMDVISAGGTVAFALECYENGIITKEMTDGLKLKWGDSKAIVALVKKMIAREGIGDLLADGVKVAAAKLGVSDKPYAVHAGGQEPGMHDSRMDPVLAIHYSTDPTPGRHTIGSGQYYDMMALWEKVSWAPNPGFYSKADEYIPSDKVALKTVAASCYKELTDGAGGCLFAMVMGVNHWRLFDWLNAATGWNKTPDELMEIGKNIQTLRQLFNIKHGIDPKNFKISSRMAGNPPLTEGPNKGKSVRIEEMMHLHWKNYGWDEKTGIPPAELIGKLKNEQLIQEEVA
jgi:aldehyde:ferredoxin oxidoreductase